jgi:hypothetical protein
MFKKRYRPPDAPFDHAEDCKIAKADPGFEPPWSEVETGYWVRECVCSKQHWRAPATQRTRVDPLDPSRAVHSAVCEVKDADPATLRLALKVRPGADDGYVVVECAACDYLWQVPSYIDVT